MGMLLGTYLSKPVTTKHSNDEEDDRMVYGVSSMQGWRETQEDAHNCILDYDPGVSYFAVYDGHGGAEVSEYTAQKLPDFLKLNRHYLRGDYEAALKDAFVKFDCTLKKRKVVKYLHKLARETRRWSREKDEVEEENLRSLKAEALMPLEEVLAKYALKRIKMKNKKRSKGSKSSKARETDENACPSSSKETVSEVSSDAPECSSSKSNTVSFSESDSEVTSSSSVCALLKKSLSEKCSNNGDVDKTILDSTSNGSEGGSSNSSGSSQNVSEGVTLSSQSIVSGGEAQLESSEVGESGKSAPSATCSKSVENKDVDVKCNGESVDVQSDEVISSSVENGEMEVSKSSRKGKSLVKPKPKRTGEGKENVNEASSESDSDDATFAGPDSKSDDDGEEEEDEEDDDDDEEEEEEDEDEEEEEEGDDEDEEDEEREEDEEKDEDDEKGEDEDEKEGDEENRSRNVGKLEGHPDESEDEDEDEDKENDSERTLLAPGSDSGCTALVALIKNDKLYVANAGDCRCVVSKDGEAVELSLDHKPENEIELRRIEKAGGRVHGGRVNDGLNLSRAIGDHVYKQTPGLPPEEQMISPLPDIQILDLDPNIEFMVLACDGIWNSMSSQEVVDFVRPRLQNRTGVVSKICEQLFDHCLAPDTLCDGTGCDNMTAIIVQFKNSRFFTSKKRPIEENEAEEAPKKQKTADATSDDSIDSSQPSESFLEKPSNSPDTTQ